MFERLLGLLEFLTVDRTCKRLDRVIAATKGLLRRSASLGPLPRTRAASGRPGAQNARNAVVGGLPWRAFALADRRQSRFRRLAVHFVVLYAGCLRRTRAQKLPRNFFVRGDSDGPRFCRRASAV